LTEGLIGRLSRLPKLKVIARSSVFRYKDGAPDPQAVARELNVKAVLVGQVAQRDDKVSVNLELVDARDSRRIWGEQYERKLADVLTLEKEITREAAAALRRKLAGAEQEQPKPQVQPEPQGQPVRAIQPQTAKAEAHQLYLKGRYQWNMRTPQSL